VRDVAAAAGINVADKAFWKKSLKVIEDNIETLAELYARTKNA